MYFYLYKITNLINNKIYIGVHKTDNINDNYLGSGHALRRAIEKYGKENFKKEILEYFNSAEEMYSKELEIVNEEFYKRKDNYNLRPGGYGCLEDYSINTREKISKALKGKISVKDKDGNTFKVLKDDPRYLSGELVPFANGVITVKDKDGNKFRTSTTDPRYLSGELVHISKNYKWSDEAKEQSGLKGKVSVKDKDGNIYRIDKNDSRIKSGEFIHLTKGKVSVKDKDGNTFFISVDDPRYLSGELVHISKGVEFSNEHRKKLSDSHKGKPLSNECKEKLSNKMKGRVSVKDKDGNILKVSKDDPRYLSGELIPECKGRKYSDEIKKKMSEARKEYWRKRKEIVLA